MKLEILYNFIWRSFQLLGKQGVVFFTFIICARYLEVYDFGIYNYILAIVFFLIIFSDFGISTATSKFVTEYNILSKDKLNQTVFNSSLVIILFGTIVVLLVLLFGQHIFKENFKFVLLVLPLIILAPLTSLYDGIFRGLKKFKQLAIISSTVGIIFIVVTFFSVKYYGLSGVLISQNVFYFVLLFVLAYYHGKFKIKFNSKIINEIGSYSLIVGLGSLGFFMYSRIDVIFLGAYGYIEEISYFEIINKILMFLLIPFTIYGQVISPDITTNVINHDYNLIRKKFSSFLATSLVSSLIIILIIFIFSDLFISSIFPKYYNSTMMAIVNISLVMFFTQFLNGFLPFISNATGHAKLNTFILIGFGIFHVLLNYIFINWYGYIGIAYSIVITKTIADLTFIYIYYRIIKKLGLSEKERFAI